MDRVQLHSIKLKGEHRLSSVKLLIGNDPHDVGWAVNKKIGEVRFETPVELHEHIRLTLRIRYHSGLFTKRKDLTIESRQLISIFKSNGSQETRDYHHRDEGFEITATIQRSPTSVGNKTDSVSTTEYGKLVPTIDEISKICPQFRILLIGAAGVGKSSLLNAVFGKAIAEVQHDERGAADINKELTTPENKHLILHDSRGFEHGEGDTFHLVEQFIQDRARRKDIKERLHAIWLCLKIPIAGERLIEVSTEKLLQMNYSGGMGGIPLIVVLTKYDELVKEARRDIMEEAVVNPKDPPRNIDAEAKVKANERLEEICIEPLKNKANSISRAVVSTREEYKKNIEDLVQKTYSLVGEYIKSGEPSLMVAIAQQASPSVKIDALIRVGKKRYWGSITAGTMPLSKSLKECLEVIHIDIVRVWNFDDGNGLLHDPSFHQQMYSLLEDLDKPNFDKPKGVLTAGVPMVGVLAGVMTALAGPVAPIVVPIAAGVVLAAWVLETYIQTGATLRRLMSYIVDLTLVMQNVYFLHKTCNQPLDAWILNTSLESYRKIFMGQVHGEIHEYVSESGISGKGCDRALEKIEKLIRDHEMSVEDMEELKKAIAH